jgi:DNA (cytosine-5)-methyltransferase 1
VTIRRARPRLLDLFCKAGGCSVGYDRAGFDVVGVDVELQPRYPFEFHLADALTFPLDGFDAIHASPPCQHYAPVTRWRGAIDHHPDLVDTIRERLIRTGVPWVIENVPAAPVRPHFMLCGSAFGLRVQRHRWFETSWSGLTLTTPCQHRDLLPFAHKGERAYADAMGCGWMTNREARDAIPPAYTEHIGTQLLTYLDEGGR